MFAGITRNESLAVLSQNVLSRVVAQERENALLQGDVQLREEEARRATAEERAAFAEVEASVQEVVRLCLSCATSVRDAAVTDAVVQLLTQQIGEEEAAAQSFALEAQHERVALLARRAASADEKTAEDDDACRQEYLERAVDEEEGRRERLEIMRVEQERLELERRTELATLRYARELFHVNTE